MRSSHAGLELIEPDPEPSVVKRGPSRKELLEENKKLRFALGRLVGHKQLDSYLEAVAEGRVTY